MLSAQKRMPNPAFVCLGTRRVEGCRTARMSTLRLLLVCLVLSPFLFAAEPSEAQKELQVLVTRQQTLLSRAAQTDESKLDLDELKRRVQDLCWDYDAYLKKHPDVAAAYATYGTLLGRIDMRRESIAMYMKANKLDPNLAMVKNQIGNYLAEDGKPLEAVNYFLSAVKLEPNEPLYHYQLGTLLTEARDDFLKSGEWTRAAVDKAMHAAFQKAAELSPDRIEFSYRYCESFADLEHPDWDAAMKAWTDLEERQPAGVAKETIRLQKINILIHQKKFDAARIQLSAVTEEKLATQKEKLVALLRENEKK